MRNHDWTEEELKKIIELRDAIHTKKNCEAGRHVAREFDLLCVYCGVDTLKKQEKGEK